MDFQERVRNSTATTILLEAGCGSGKTVSAYLWASQRANNKRLFFCYPTTGTASEGFSGYMRDPDFDAMLIHSRADVDYRLLENMPERNHEENEFRRERLEALETWPIPAVVCTAHTVLGIMENVRRGLYAWPSLLQSVFVFDEIHSFSDLLFCYLLRFLKAFSHIPVLLMTATLPPVREKALKDICSQRGDFEIISGSPQRENAHRYRIHKTDYDSAISKTREILSSDGKVLWICNTVSRCMDNFVKFLDMGFPCDIYHSRYKYKDRLKRHRQVIDGFLPGHPPRIAVTTQVAEMSLDISSDMLVSDMAPIPAMIQRLGRLNRYQAIPDKVMDALFIPPENLFPYASNGEEFQILNSKINQWIDLVSPMGSVSQRDLFEAFIKVEESSPSPESPRPVPHCQWLDDLWRSEKNKKSIVESSPIAEIVCEEDRTHKTLEEWVIPMPLPRSQEDISWEMHGRYLIAPKGTINYDELRGALWNLKK